MGTVAAWSQPVSNGMSISIFARPHYFGVYPLISNEPFLCRATSFIRGEQMAEYLGAKYNPVDGYENDVCIYLRPQKLDKIKDGSYVDVSDSGEYIIKLLETRPKIKLIASSLVSYEYLKGRLKNEIVLIPEHHCNFNRDKRTRKEVAIAGYVGAPTTYDFANNEEIRKRLEEIGLKFITYYYFKTRQDAVDFFKQIDLLVVGRFGFPDVGEIFRHPTKMISAASFGIPTVANWKMGYKEFEGNYIPVNNIDSLVAEVEKMKNKDYYDVFAKKIIDTAEPYHIENIAKLYKELNHD